MHNRIDWVDYCKGIGIFLVVVGHVLGGLEASGIISNSHYYSLIEAWMYAFHMPLFFFLSGLFIQRSAQRSFLGFILNKLNVLIYPYILWSMLQGLLETAGYGNHSLSPIELLKITYVPIGQYWFLYTLFIITTVYALFYRFISTSAIVFFLISTVCFVIERSGLNTLEWDITHDVASFLIYFGAGIVIARGSLLTRPTAFENGWLIGICIAGYAAVALGVAIERDYQAVVLPGCAGAGIIATIALAILISRPKRVGFVKLWGILSLEIYVAHVIAAAIVRVGLHKVLGVSDPSLHFVMGTIVGIYIPIFFAYFLFRMGFPYAFALSQSRVPAWERNLRRSMAIGV
jgi:fucose 4-O-acetylase-like acetyltransferase